MSKEKQIEEMAKVIKSSLDGLGSGNFNFTGGEISIMFAEALYNAGYRKQSEGEWIQHEDDWCGNYYTCSACGCDWTTIDGTPWENNMRYCPECGAKMKGGRSDDAI